MPPVATAPADSTSAIVWQHALLGGSTGRQTIETGGLTLPGSQRVEVYLVLEGERAGLPVYCCSLPRLRVDGRAIPARMVVHPRDVGLARAEVQWQLLRPTADATNWMRTRLRAPEDRWVLPMAQIAEAEAEAASESRPERSTEFRPNVGTVRLAAAIRLPRDGIADPFLSTDGWNRRPGWEDPEKAPGFRVTHGASPTLAGWAEAYSRLPVFENATSAHVREFVALAPNDLVLAAYGLLRGHPLDGPRHARLDSAEWEWVFETTVATGYRKTEGPIPWVGDRGQGIRWSRPGTPDGPSVRTGDILILETGPAFLRRDDGDGWLDNGDTALQIRNGKLEVMSLDGLEGRRVRFLRPRDFGSLRRKLTEAGYGTLGQSYFFGTDLERALQDFQNDHGIEATGHPDEETLGALDEFLTRMRQPESETVAPSGP